MLKITMLESDLPQWQRTAFADEDQIFLPCGTFGDEREETLCLIFDGVPIVENEGHAYASTDWLIGEYPDQEKEIHRIVGIIREKIRSDSMAKSSNDH